MKTLQYPILIMLSLIAFSFTSCDKIPEDEYLLPIDIKTSGQYVILEDYTGLKCNNCPLAAIKATELKALYPNLIVVAVHATSFAKPDTKGKLTADYRTLEGIEWAKTFGINSAPKGMVNRANSKAVYSVADWGSAISNEMAKTPIVTLDLNNMAYNETTHTFSANVKALFLENVNYNVKISTLILEDSVIGNQLGPTGDTIENYTFMHMLRKVEGGDWGKTFVAASENVQAQDTVVMPIQVQLNSEWKAKNCHVVVYLSKNEPSNKDYSIIQATEQPIIGNHKK